MLTASDLLKLQSVEPALANLVKKVAARCNIGIAQGLRFLEQEKQEIKAGRSWLKNPKNGKHLPDSNGLSRAIDFFVRGPDGKPNWDEKLYPAVVAIFKDEAKKAGLTIVCGADWSVRDWGHVQLQ